jgi:hypothetical protein
MVSQVNGILKQSVVPILTSEKDFKPKVEETKKVSTYW